MTASEWKAMTEYKDFILNRLGLSTDAENTPDIAALYKVLDVAQPIRPDYIFQKGEQFYVVEGTISPVTIDTIARLQLYRNLLERKVSKQIQLVLVAKTMKVREEELARQLGIQYIRLPWAMKAPKGIDYRLARTKISSEKSWRIVSRLVKEKGSSIRQLAVKENVSYAWAHKAIELLVERNIAKREDGFVTISDVNKLLSGIAWERPLKNLQLEEIHLNYNFGHSHEAAQDISHNLKEENIEFAFNSYTAGGLYTGYAFRHDAVYLYLDKKQIDGFREQYATKEQSGILAVVYAPDRDVFSEIQARESIVVTSPSQTLLDLAGLGYAAMDLTIVMVDTFASL